MANANQTTSTESLDPDLLEIRNLLVARERVNEAEGQHGTALELHCILTHLDNLPAVKAQQRYIEHQAEEAIQKMSLLQAAEQLPALLKPEFQSGEGLLSLTQALRMLDLCGYRLESFSEDCMFKAISATPRGKRIVQGRLFTPAGGQAPELGLNILEDYGTRTCFNGRLSRIDPLRYILESIA